MLSAGARVCEAVVPGGVREIVATIQMQQAGYRMMLARMAYIVQIGARARSTKHGVWHSMFRNGRSRRMRVDVVGLLGRCTPRSRWPALRTSPLRPSACCAATPPT